MNRFSLFIKVALCVLLLGFYLAYLALPGLLTRPRAGDDVVYLEAWMEKHGYAETSRITGATSLAEADRERDKDPKAIRNFEERKQKDTLLKVAHLQSHRKPCGLGYFLVFWRVSSDGFQIEEIHYDDQFCYM